MHGFHSAASLDLKCGISFFGASVLHKKAYPSIRASTDEDNNTSNARYNKTGVWRATYLRHTSDYTPNFCQEIVSLARNDTQPTKESSFPLPTYPTAYINRKYDKHLNPPSCGTEQLNRARLLLKIQDEAFTHISKRSKKADTYTLTHLQRISNLLDKIQDKTITLISYNRPINLIHILIFNVGRIQNSAENRSSSGGPRAATTAKRTSEKSNATEPNCPKPKLGALNPPQLP